MRCFVAQWLNGLTPYLLISTKPDGSIVVTSKVSSSLNSPATEARIDNNLTRCRRRRSGFNARLRRRRERIARKEHEATEIIIRTSKLDNDNLVPMAMTCAKPKPVSDCSTMTSPTEMNLSVQKLTSLDIIPQESSPRSKLSIENVSTVSISPRTIYHPSIINACFAIIGKHPSQMSPSEVKEFDMYVQFKARIGESIENDVVYLPVGGIRTCLHCQNPT